MLTLALQNIAAVVVFERESCAEYVRIVFSLAHLMYQYMQACPHPQLLFHPLSSPRTTASSLNLVLTLHPQRLKVAPTLIHTSTCPAYDCRRAVISQIWPSSTTETIGQACAQSTGRFLARYIDRRAHSICLGISQ